ncbi:hypothetical protein ACGFNV_40055 [Streptomyces sp. NPDC048751]|uniref:hypothetical protein n=1 Tax=Streptomyces sp. NPDC048751 TaxID=3365591 RepID=UPI0037127E5D
MSDGSVTLFLPCDVVRVRATLDFGPGVSAVEEIVLRALTVQPMPVQELANLLALPRPVIADMVHALWRIGHLTVVPDSGDLVVSPGTADAVAAGRMNELSGAVREERTLTLMIDPLLGQALPAEPGRRAPQDQRVEPLRGGVDPVEISSADLRRAAAAALHGETEHGSAVAQRAMRGRRVLEVHVQHGPAVRHWRPVLVRPWLGQSTGTLGVTVVDPRVPPAAREAGSTRLTQLVADRPDARFTRHLRSHAVSQTLTAPTVEGLADNLARRAGRLAGLQAGQRAGHHEQLTEAAVQLGESMAARIEHEAVVEPLRGGSLVGAAAQLIDEARTQVVILASRLTPSSSRILEAHLAGAVHRGVQVVLLLENLESVSAGLLALAGSEHPARLVLPRQPTTAQAGLVIMDDEMALVLAGTVLRGDCTLGLRLGAPGGGVCPAVRALLSWVRTVAPDWTTAKAILPRPSWSAPDTTPPEATGVDRLPEPPPPDDTSGAATAAWEAAWRAYAEGHRELLRSRSLPQTRWVTGALHDNLLWHALRTVERRLVIASNRISDRVVDDRFLALLRGRLERGVIVTLAHPSVPRHLRPPGLDALSAEFPETLLLIEAPRGARAVVWDDDCVLLATDPLASVPSATAAGPGRSSLGLWLTGAAIADRIATAMGEPAIVTDRVTSIPSAHSGPPRSLTRIRAFNVAQRIRNRWHEGSTMEEALAPLVAEDDPWPVLDCLMGIPAHGEPPLEPGASEFASDNADNSENSDDSGDTDLTDRATSDIGVAVDTAGTPDDLLCSAVAWCLTRSADRTDATTLDRWREWLIQRLWLSGRFAEAALLRLGHPSDASPRSSLTVVAAAFGTEVSTIALLTALEDTPRSPAEDAALLCVAAAESLRTADDDHTDILKRLVPHVPSPWGDLGDAVLGYHAVARGLPPELLLRPAVDRAARARRLGVAWEELARAVDRAQRTQPAFIDLKRLQVALFKRSGPFGALEAAAEHRDVDAVRMFLASHSAFDHSDGRAVDAIIDDIWFGVTVSPIALQGSLRKAFSVRLVAILAAAREVLDAEESLSRHPGVTSASAHQDAVHALATRIQDLSADLTTAAHGLSHPETGLAVHALQQVFRMTEPEVP